MGADLQNAPLVFLFCFWSEFNKKLNTNAWANSFITEDQYGLLKKFYSLMIC